MQDIFTSTSKVMVDIKTGSPLLYMPLDKLLTGQGPAAALPPSLDAPVPATRGAAAEQAPSAIDARSRDSQRNRDRETR